ncbi:MAG: FAD:protein FMN transferase [Puniceicoccales bacterium]|jgi:thiamine biosynthesis lipoprotein|nr:FAD:protein FMN transferase [Puniceicoccales bacterium]
MNENEAGGAQSPGKSLRFTREAMNADFTIFVDSQDTDPEVAEGAAQAAFALLENLEQTLSLFVHFSDVSKVNALKSGESYQLSSEGLDCLVTAAQVAADTERAFDPSAGALISFWKNRGAVHSNRCEEEPEWQAAWEAHRHGEFALDPDSRMIQCVVAGSKLDLGGIGKGHALDRMAALIEGDWGLSRLFLSAGGSTVLALDPPLGREGWKLGFGGETRLPRLLLTRQALSSSGNLFQPAHLVNPRDGHLVTRSDLVRAVAENAAKADALSTAFFIMDREEIEKYCSASPYHAALLAACGEDGVPERFDIPRNCNPLHWDAQD